MRAEMWLPVGSWPVREQVLEEVAREVGGYTLLDGIGVWMGREGKCEEKVQVLMVFGKEELRGWMRGLARRFGIGARQECVMVAFDGKEEFIETCQEQERVAA